MQYIQLICENIYFFNIRFFLVSIVIFIPTAYFTALQILYKLSNLERKQNILLEIPKFFHPKTKNILLIYF